MGVEVAEAHCLEAINVNAQAEGGLAQQNISQPALAGLSAITPPIGAAGINQPYLGQPVS